MVSRSERVELKIDKNISKVEKKISPEEVGEIKRVMERNKFFSLPLYEKKMLSGLDHQ